MKDSYCVYKHICSNGKVYIGITCRNPLYRWNHGNGYKSNSHFWNAIIKYGWDNIKHEILYDGLSKEEACEIEMQLIRTCRSYDREYGYNNSLGGEHGLHSEQSKAKIKEHHADFSGKNAYWYGKKLSDEHRAKLRDSHMGNKSRARAVCRYSSSGKYIDCFSSSVEAAAFVGASHQNIRKVCDGKRKHAGGYCWKWLKQNQ